MDDNFALLRAYKRGLETYGFEVVTACHGIDALMQYQANKGDFKIVVTDLEMPEMCGLQFMHAIREAGFTGKIFVVSGCIQPEVQEAYERYAISGFIHKPFELRLLVVMLLQED